jgi:hypothetical protein
MTSVWKTTRSLLLALLTTSAVLCTIPSVSAAAGTHQMRVFVCHGPAGEAAVQEDWSIGSSNRVGWMYAEDTCTNSDQGSLRVALGANPSGFAGWPHEPEIYWTYTSPAWATIASFELQVPGSYAYPAPGGGVGEAWIEDSEKTDPSYDLRNLGGGAWGATTVTDEAKGTMTWVQLFAACDGGGGSCPAGTPISSIEVDGGSIVLDDLTTPTASMIAGPLSEPGPVSATSEISFHATDTNGPGIYSAWLEVDGTRQPATIIGKNTSATCRNLQPTTAAPAFDTTQPCPSELDSSLALNTAILHDGKHTVKLYIQDAAGSTNVAWSGTIQTNNAPIVTANPIISGTAQVGSALSASHGSYTAPPGAGPLSGITSQWLRCTDEAAQHCSIITGATNQTYTPIPADTGYRLVYQETISDTDGTTNADSAPTIPVTNPAADANCGGGCIGAGGNATSSSASGVPPITINLPQNALNAGSRQLGSPAAWNLTLRVNPTVVHEHTRITITGKVWTRPLPTSGKLVDLRARSVRTKCVVQGATRHYVTTYGPWSVFAVLNTKANGSFTFHYRFKQGGKHTYQIQAVAPHEGGYTNASGTSNVYTVHEL